MYSKSQQPKPHKERVYVQVNSDFDCTGFMMPKSITWDDGRVFQIDSVTDFRPASSLIPGSSMAGDCYTVIIRGKMRHLFFERCDPLFASQVGRWFVEKTAV